MSRLAVVFLVFASTISVKAQTPPEDKSQFSLFNPTPRELWRPLSADRPDFTESPYTVDAGAIQFELSFVDYSRNGDDEAWAIAPANLKLGLLNNMDLQFVFDPYSKVDDGSVTHIGIGDIQFRLKINLWGNDSGDTAFAFMPFIKLPTASDKLGSDRVEGGLIFPFATTLSEGVGLGLMFEADFLYDIEEDDYDIEFVTTGVLGFDMTDEIGLYVEGIGITSTDSNVGFRGILGAGATYRLTENMILDAGVNIGLFGDSDDVNLFTGISVRF
jgi:Putative MetA-pathway of phenol degradation